MLKSTRHTEGISVFFKNSCRVVLSTSAVSYFFCMVIFFTFSLLFVSAPLTASGKAHNGILTPAKDAQARTIQADEAGKDSAKQLPSQHESDAPPAKTPPQNAQKDKALPKLSWEAISPGIELTIVCLQPEGADDNTDRFVAIRLSPDKVSFSLHMASESGAPLPLKDWATLSGLRAGINASMYLPDMVTSTGYMRSITHTNNSYIGSKLGAFFVAIPLEDNLPTADIVEQDTPEWKETLTKYGMVIQNYRLVDASGSILWPEEGQAHSTAVVSKDNKGRIIFILCQTPLLPALFARHVQEFFPDITSIMYVEGGTHAGLFLFEDHSGAPKRPGAVTYEEKNGFVHVWKGRQALFNLKGSPTEPLPNILGVKSSSH